MLKYEKAQRLRSKQDFDTVFKESMSFACTSIVMLYKKREYSKNDTKGPRIGIIVSKKVNKRAVVRNKVKRLIRESFRLNQTRFKNNFNYDCIIIARTSCNNTPNKRIMASLSYCFDKVFKKQLVQES